MTVIACAAIEVAVNILAFAFIPLELLKEQGGVTDDSLVALGPIGSAERHDIDAGDIVEQLRLRLFAGDMPLLRIDQRLDKPQGLDRHGIFLPDLACFEQARQADARDAKAALLAPAAIIRLHCPKV